jgi:hypothetical protein
MLLKGDRFAFNQALSLFSGPVRMDSITHLSCLCHLQSVEWLGLNSRARGIDHFSQLALFHRVFAFSNWASQRFLIWPAPVRKEAELDKVDTTGTSGTGILDAQALTNRIETQFCPFSWTRRRWGLPIYVFSIAGIATSMSLWLLAPPDLSLFSISKHFYSFSFF